MGSINFIKLLHCQLILSNCNSNCSVVERRQHREKKFPKELINKAELFRSHRVQREDGVLEVVRILFRIIVIRYSDPAMADLKVGHFRRPNGGRLHELVGAHLRGFDQRDLGIESAQLGFAGHQRSRELSVGLAKKFLKV